MSEALRTLIGIWDDREKVCAVGEASLCDLEWEATSGDCTRTGSICGDKVLAECRRPRVGIGLGWCVLPWISSVCGLVTSEIP